MEETLKTQGYTLYYFREISRLYLRAMGMIFKMTPEREEEKKAEMRRIREELSGIIAQKNVPEWIRKELSTAIGLISKNNAPASCAALLSAIEMFYKALVFVPKKQWLYPECKIWFNCMRQVYNVLQGELVDYNIDRMDREKRVPMRIQVVREYALLWDAFRSTDHQVDNQFEEVVWINTILKLLEGGLREDDIAAAVLKLERARVLVKELACFGLKIIMAQLEHGNSTRAKDTAFIVSNFLRAREEVLREMIISTQNYRLKFLRDALEERNEELTRELKKILENLKQGARDEALAGLKGFKENKRLMHYLEEPDFTDAKKLLNYALHLLKRGNDGKATGLLTAVLSRITDAQQYLAGFVEHFRDQYVKRSLQSPFEIISKEKVFEDVFKAYLKNANISRGEPGFKKRILKASYWWGRFYQAIFISRQIDNPLQRRERIPNPGFEVVGDYLAAVKKLKSLKSYKEKRNKLFESACRTYKDSPGTIDSAQLEKVCFVDIEEFLARLEDVFPSSSPLEEEEGEVQSSSTIKTTVRNIIFRTFLALSAITGFQGDSRSGKKPLSMNQELGLVSEAFEKAQKYTKSYWKSPRRQEKLNNILGSNLTQVLEGNKVEIDYLLVHIQMAGLNKFERIFNLLSDLA
ncbi:MAG TPA: hypothetical protein DEQ77_03810, partial [Candidatus Omnitrophica bacterium]|nr:hypothetical protein [Candidatus Omnitrophota bacterium]